MWLVIGLVLYFAVRLRELDPAAAPARRPGRAATADQSLTPAFEPTHGMIFGNLGAFR